MRTSAELLVIAEELLDTARSALGKLGTIQPGVYPAEVLQIAGMSITLATAYIRLAALQQGYSP